jgi:hypothetical protein
VLILLVILALGKKTIHVVTVLVLTLVKFFKKDFTMTFQEPQNLFEDEQQLSDAEKECFNHLKTKVESEAKEVPTLATRRKFLQKIVSVAAPVAIITMATASTAKACILCDESYGCQASCILCDANSGGCQTVCLTCDANSGCQVSTACMFNENPCGACEVNCDAQSRAGCTTDI